MDGPSTEGRCSSASVARGSPTAQRWGAQGVHCYNPFPQICQLEHFNKVHKKHCKYYLGTKVKEASLHNPYSCPKCVQMRAIGKGNMTLQEGSFVCIFDNQAYVTGVFQLQKNKKVGF
jgi:hypothetical protein